jgi:hypothetical protein
MRDLQNNHASNQTDCMPTLFSRLNSNKQNQVLAIFPYLNAKLNELFTLAKARLA